MPTDKLEFDFEVGKILNEDLGLTQNNNDGIEARLIGQETGLTFSVGAKLSF